MIRKKPITGVRLRPESSSQPLDSPSDRKIIHASILKSRFDLWRLQRDLHDTVLISRQTILQSRELIAKVDEALARR
jgi:hypothetical protein